MANPLPGSIFQKALDTGASDVHIVADAPLLFRINGELTPQTLTDISPEEAASFVRGVLSDADFAMLQDKKEVDVPYALKDGTRLRINCHYERGNLGLVARVIPGKIPGLEDIRLETIVPSIAENREGLILFTGPTGTGKSTSLASMIQYINATHARSIITLEDPIEFLYPRGKGVIRQRQFGEDFLSFGEALKRVLRQDPDIIMMGEMRDTESIAAALTLAETGHLILATLHTPNTAQTIGRIIDVFPSFQQPQIRLQLSMSLRAVVAQRLLPKVGGGRVAQREVLVNNAAVSNIIRDNRIPELQTVLQTSHESGMVSFEKDAKTLLREGLIGKETFDAAIGTEKTKEEWRS